MPITWDEAGLEECRQTAGSYIDTVAGSIIDAANPPVDTGFLRASAYVHSSRWNTFDSTWESGEYESTKGRGMEQRERVDSPEQPPDEYGAVVGWAAIYAYVIEDQQPFMYPALLAVAEEGGGEADPVAAVAGEWETNYLVNLLMS